MVGRSVSRSALALTVGILLCSVSVPARAIDCLFACTPAGSTDCTCYDYDTSDACIITTIQTMPAGAIVDCGSRDIDLKDRVEVDNGFITIRARNLTVETYRTIAATRSQNVPFGIIIELSGWLDLTGVLEAKSDFGGGVVFIDAAGNISVPAYIGASDGINVNATAPGTSGGSIELTSGGSVTIDDPLEADGAADGVSDGGQISIRAAGSITIRDRVNAFGHLSNGGTITFTTENGTISMQDFVKAEGGGTQGNGGEIYLNGKGIITSALLSAQGGLSVGGGFAMGGTVQFDAGSDGISINADIDVTGGEDGSGLNGGAIVADSDGPITIADGVSLVTKSDANGGDGGDILLASDGALTVGDATLDARGDWINNHLGTGARIALRACALTVQSGALLDARGHDGGTIELTGRETLTVSSASVVDVTANGGQVGSIVLAYRVTGRCATATSEGCEVAQCTAPPGTCGNDPNRTCSSNADCTTGCGGGQCLFSPATCSNNANATCTSDNDCTGCSTGSCTANANPNTGGVTTQFNPGPPQMLEDFNLEPCN